MADKTKPQGGQEDRMGQGQPQSGTAPGVPGRSTQSASGQAAPEAPETERGGSPAPQSTNRTNEEEGDRGKS
jgi:hypothetical protein